MAELEQNDNSKVEKRYSSNLQKLISLLGGEEPSKVAKVNVPNSEVAMIVEELLKERKTEVIALFKQRASDLLNKKVEFDKFVKQKQKELENAILDKKKEFTKQMEECFALVENIDALHTEYTNSLQDVGRQSE